MVAGVLIGLGIFFFLFVPLGIYTNSFLLYGIGLTGAGLSFVLFSLLANSNWKGFTRVLAIPYFGSVFIFVYRLFIFSIGILALFGASAFWLDLPAYIKKEYSKLEGIPSEITYETAARGEVTGTMIVTINEKSLPLQLPPNYSKADLDGHYFQIFYLPNTEWTIDFKIDGIQKE